MFETDARHVFKEVTFELQLHCLHILLYVNEECAWVGVVGQRTRTCWIGGISISEISEFAKEKVRDEEVFYCLFATVGVAEQIGPQHLEAGLLYLEHLIKWHRGFLQFFLNLLLYCLVVHRVQKILVVCDFAFVAFVPQLQVDLLSTESYLECHIAFFLNARKIVLCHFLEFLRRAKGEDFVELLLYAQFLGDCYQIVDLSS